jgi:hypothetical protein
MSILGQMVCVEGCGGFDRIPLVNGPIIDEQTEVLNMPIGLQDVLKIKANILTLRCGHERMIFPFKMSAQEWVMYGGQRL